jgi:GxGYxYP putative glycoside hydrolase C-terminal domain
MLAEGRYHIPEGRPVMKNPTNKLAALLAVLLFLVIGQQKAQASQAYALDTNGLENVEDLYLIGTLQGIVNRDAPRLFLTRGTADNVYLDYLEKEKGVSFTRLKSLPDTIATFVAMKRADGTTPLIKGLVKYPTTYWDAASRTMVNRYYNYWIAANFAAQEDLLPVSDGVLNYRTPMMSGAEFWHKDGRMGGWSEMFVQMQHADATGLKVTSSRVDAYASKVVYVDLAVTPKIEIVVSELTPGGAWSLAIAMGSTIKASEHSQGVLVPGLTKETGIGTFVVDLAKTGLFNPRAGRAELHITPSAPGVAVTITSIRLLDANGKEPAAAPYVPRKDVFAGLPVKRDLITAPPYKQDEDSACAWSLENQRGTCLPDAFASYAAGAWILMGLDYTVAKRVYHFYQDKCPFTKGGYPYLDRILADLKAPGLVFGWLSDEDYSCMKMAKYGARYAGGVPQNFSFWQWIPLKQPGKPVPLPQFREATRLENKVYVNFSWASADYIQFSYNLMDGFWQDPKRGTVPATWGFNPLLAKYAPAFVEYFARSATPRDSFWGFTAGYTHLSGFSQDHLQTYAEETRHGIDVLGLSPAVDVWDCFPYCRDSYEALSMNSSTSTGVKLISVLPSETKSSETYWLDNGCPVVRLDGGLFSVWQKDGKSTPESLVASIRAAADKHPEKGPQFLTCNSRFSPTFLKAVHDLLPANVVMVGMPDFIALAQEAGAVNALPFSNAVGSGDDIKVTFELHNASGATGDAGTVSWTLPPGWKSSPDSWRHGSVPQGTCLKQTVTWTPPANLTSGTVLIGYGDSRFAWKKELALTTYPQAANVSNCESLNGWTATDGASILIDRGMLKVVPRVGLERHDFTNGERIPNNGRVSCALKQIDFSRKPVLKINFPDQDSHGSKIGLIDEVGQYKECANFSVVGVCFIDLSSATKWTGTKDLTLCIDPASGYGRYARIRSIKVFYP